MRIVIVILPAFYFIFIVFIQKPLGFSYITVKINYYNLSNTNTILYTIFVFINQFHFLFEKIFTSIRREFLLYLTLLATFATWSMCDQWGPWLGRVKLRLPWFSRWCWAELPVVRMPFFPAHAPLLLAAGPLVPFLIGSISCCIHCPCVLHVNA